MGMGYTWRADFIQFNKKMKFPSFKSIGLAVIGAFFLVQSISLLVSSVFTSIPVFRGGYIILIMLLSVGIMSVFILAINIEELRNKNNLIFIIIVFGLLALAYWKLPDYFPQIFGIDPSISAIIKNSIGSIFGG